MTIHRYLSRLQFIFAALAAAMALRQGVAGDVPSPVFTNSLGMPFARVPGTKVLFCIWSTRVQDCEVWLKETHQTAEPPGFKQGPTHPAVNVNWIEAKAFCEWLTDKERKAGRIAKEQSYRLPTDAEWSVAAGLKESVEGTPASKDGKVPDFFPWGREWPPPKGRSEEGEGARSPLTVFTHI
jgi:hypothetical protein